MTFSNRGNDRFRGTNSRPTMHDATCAKCGASCQVPFMPNGRKEVFCSKCFGEMNGSSRDNRDSYGSSRAPRMFDKRDSGSSFSERQMFRATCDQCGDSCEVPFRPTNGKPVLCSNCFAEKNNDGGRPMMSKNSYTKPSVDNSVVLEAINAKLDKILKLLSPASPKAEVDETTQEAKEVAKMITSKILEEIESTSGKPVVAKKKAKSVTKKSE